MTSIVSLLLPSSLLNPSKPTCDNEGPSQPSPLSCSPNATQHPHRFALVRSRALGKAALCVAPTPSGAAVLESALPPGHPIPHVPQTRRYGLG